MTEAAKTTRVFLAHPKSATDEKLWWWGGYVTQWLKEAGFAAEVILGRQDYEQHFASEGNFDGWARSVPRRRDTFTGEKTYDSIFVPGYTVGKATAMIVQAALEIHTPVFIIDETQEPTFIQQAAAITEIDKKDYFNGWRLLTD